MFFGISTADWRFLSLFILSINPERYSNTSGWPKKSRLLAVRRSLHGLGQENISLRMVLRLAEAVEENGPGFHCLIVRRTGFERW